MMQDVGWYYAVNGQRQGPVPVDQLRQLLIGGQLSAADLVWRDGMPDWQPIASIPGLAAAAPPPSYSPPPGYAPPPGHAPPPGVAPQYGYAPAPMGYSAPTYGGQSSQGMAIAGFVLSLCIAPLGLIFSWIALSNMKRSGNPEGKGLATAGLVVSIVLCSIWCLYLAGIATCIASF